MTLVSSFTVTLNLVIQASTDTMFASPPKAANTRGAFSAISPLAEVFVGAASEAAPLPFW